MRGEEDPDKESNVGELLKRKAKEGVKVILMLWDEKYSDQLGLMGTHDDETRRYFKRTAVECLLVGRSKREGILASEFVGSCYTHHQKTVICDAPMEDDSGMKRIIGFIGGLDITNGRYDDPTFPLWSTIPTVHSTDFHNAIVPGVTQETGPREPWHDCHAKVEGPIALDLMKNFEERVRRQAEDNVHSLFRPSGDEFVLDAPAALQEYEGGEWTVQLFRSITQDSALFDFDRQQVLFRKGGMFVERSIMNIMVQKIRNAKNFIYLENQYFLGSAYAWQQDCDIASHHLIPTELTRKIVDKIGAGEDFKVYALIPMFPEGDPMTAPIQEILFWQFRTMEAMYKDIAAAINDSGNGKHPTDYLSFYCLGKRESEDEMPEGFADPEPGSQSEKVRSSRRHPVYVHSKMTIIDDSYVLVGSANINQRSLGGNR